MSPLDTIKAALVPSADSLRAKLGEARRAAAEREEHAVDTDTAGAWRAARDARDLVYQIECRLRAAEKREAAEAAKRAEAERAKLAEQRAAVVDELDEDRRRKALEPALNAIRTQLFAVVDALAEIDAADELAAAAAQDVHRLDRQLGQPLTALPSPLALRPTVRGNLRAELERELAARAVEGLTGRLYADAAALVGVV